MSETKFIVVNDYNNYRTYLRATVFKHSYSEAQVFDSEDDAKAAIDIARHYYPGYFMRACRAIELN